MILKGFALKTYSLKFVSDAREVGKFISVCVETDCRLLITSALKL